MHDINCPVCDSERFQFFSEVHDRLLNIDGTFALVKCLDCGVLYLNPQPTEEIARYYPPEYDSFSTARLGELTWLQRSSVNYGLTKRQRAATRYKKTGRLLEIGCATGAFLDAMRSTQKWDVVGVELSEHAARYAQQELHLKVFQGQLEDAAFPDKDFDVIVLWDVLEHLPDPKAALQEIHRILKDDGWLVFRVPNLDSIDAKIFGKYWAGFDAPRHFTIFSVKTLQKILEKTAFSLHKTACFSGTYPTFVLNVRFWMQEHLSPKRYKQMLHILNALPVRLLVAPVFRVIDLLKLSSVITVYARKANVL